MSNYSNIINPFLYDGIKTEIFRLECCNCSASKNVTTPHSTSDKEIMEKYYVGWSAKGHNGSTKTLCPSCKNLAKEKS